MDKVYRKIEENALRDLLIAAHRCHALERGGVDNWNWYSESIRDYVDDCIVTDEQYYDSIEDIAEEDLKNYAYV
jgi:hypothetical protein